MTTEKETDCYLERIGVGEPEPIRESPIESSEFIGINTIHWDEMYQHLGADVRTLCGWDEMLEHFTYLHTIGTIQGFEIERPEPQYINVMGGLDRVPIYPRPMATIWVRTHNSKLKFEINMWSENDVSLYLTEIDFIPPLRYDGTDARTNV